MSFAPLLPAQDRSPVVPSQEAPVKAEKQADGRWFIDFGKAAFGTVEITSPDAKAGTKAACWWPRGHRKR